MQLLLGKKGLQVKLQTSGFIDNGVLQFCQVL